VEDIIITNISVRIQAQHRSNNIIIIKTEDPMIGRAIINLPLMETRPG
jgi:hypothetical protein